jgi:phosphatidylglycerophosphatase A
MFARPALPFFHPATLLATWFGSGLVRVAPGTCGSIAALPFAAGLALLGGPWLLGLSALAAFAVGLWASGRYAGAAGQHDPAAVVIDEVAGQWLALAPLPLDPGLYLLAFLAFRLLDIAKPWPIGWVERALPGAWGIMADDLVAGMIAGALTFGVSLWLA